MSNLGFHTEIFTALSVILLIVGAILGYGGKHILVLIHKNPSDKAVLVIKFIGLLLVVTAMIIIFKR